MGAIETPAGASHELTPQHFAWLAGSLCQLNRIPFDAALLLQRYPAPHDTRQLIEACRSLGFRTGEARLSVKASFPCIVFVRAEVAGFGNLNAH